MRLLYLHQHFVCGDGAGGTRSYDVSRHLAAMGHRVTLICGRADLSGLPDMPWWQLWRRCLIDGIEVVVCNVPYSNKMNIPRRLWSFLGFGVLATLAGFWSRRPDLVFATSLPLEIIVPGSFSALFHAVPLVFEVRDLWPEDLIAAGRIKAGSLGARLQGLLERYAYWRAKRTLLVSRGFHERLLERGYPPDSLQTVLLGGDGTLFRDVEPDREYLRAVGLDGKFVAVYAGVHGAANGLEQVLDAAEHLRGRSDIAILLIGDGKRRDALIDDARRRHLTNVHLLPPVPKVRVPGILAACHLGLMILAQISRPRWVTPNKLFDYMFAGLPTIVNFAGTTAQLVESEGAGVASVPGSAEDLAAKIRYYADHPEEGRAVGERARQHAWANYDRAGIARQLAEVFEEVIYERRHPGRRVAHAQ